LIRDLRAAEGTVAVHAEVSPDSKPSAKTLLSGPVYLSTVPPEPTANARVGERMETSLSTAVPCTGLVMGSLDTPSSVDRTKVLSPPMVANAPA